LSTSFRLSLGYVGPASEGCHVFRLAFESSDDRYLLNYPEVTGLRFRDTNGCEDGEFRTQFFVTAPRDEFVLNPPDRIAFDLRAYTNLEPTIERRWTIQLAHGQYRVDYCYSLDPDRRRYDYLNKGSRFADMTKPWSGSVVSNAVEFRI
jgi:hypothetical protein